MSEMRKLIGFDRVVYDGLLHVTQSMRSPNHQLALMLGNQGGIADLYSSLYVA